jgi:RES domain-containing protein
MFLYRVCRDQYVHELSGNGSKIHGGRWNSPGESAVYASSTKSLAVLECLTNTPPGILQNDFSILTLEVTGEVGIDEISLKNLPANWNKYPAPINLAKMGDKWLVSGKNLLLKIPSAVITDEYNYIINPLHRDMKKIKIAAIEKLNLDQRISEQLK